MFDAVGAAELIRKCAGTDVSLATDDELLAAAVPWEALLASAVATSVHVLGEPGP